MATYAPGDSVTVECTKCGVVLVELCNFEAEADPEDPVKETLWKRIEARFESSDFDDHVHELVSHDASAINNGGLESQFDYLYDNAGVDWLESLLANDEGSS